MDEEYDVIVLGTGFTECVLSGLLSVDGKKVLHMDRNDYYGGESASLNLEQLWERHGRDGKPPESLGRSRDYNVDLVSKFIMSTGKLVKILLHTDVTRYLDFKVVDGSYVFRKNKVHKVPVTETEGLTSGLVGLMDKNRLRQFLGFCGQLDFDDPKTHKGFDLNKATMREVFKKFSLGTDVAEFMGHAAALYTDDSYLDKPAKPTLEKMALYAESVNQYGKSPYIYPLYGLGELPQAFSRLASIYGGTYMLKKPIEEIVFEDGKVVGVKSEGEVAKAPVVIGDPTYFKDMDKKVEIKGKVARAICILSHGLKATGSAESYQIIIPGAQLKRTNDVYIACVSHAHCVAPQGKFIVIVSTKVETDNPEKELAAGLAMLEPIEEKFFSVTDTYGPVNDMDAEQLFITNSYDAASHFESACENIQEIYKRITGNDVDLTPMKKDDEAQE